MEDQILQLHWALQESKIESCTLTAEQNKLLVSVIELPQIHSFNKSLSESGHIEALSSQAYSVPGKIDIKQVVK